MALVNWGLLNLNNGTKALSEAIEETFVFHITIKHQFILLLSLSLSVWVFMWFFSHCAVSDRAVHDTYFVTVGMIQLTAAQLSWQLPQHRVNWNNKIDIWHNLITVHLINQTEQQYNPRIMPKICALILTWFSLIPAWISNHMHGKVWDEITYPLPNFNGNHWSLGMDK